MFVLAVTPTKRTTTHKWSAETVIRFDRRPKNHSGSEAIANLLFRYALVPWQQLVGLHFCAGEKIPPARLSTLVVRDKRIIIFFLDLRIDFGKARPAFGPGGDRASTPLQRSLASPYFLGAFFSGTLEWLSCRDIILTTQRPYHMASRLLNLHSKQLYSSAGSPRQPAWICLIATWGWLEFLPVFKLAGLI